MKTGVGNLKVHDGIKGGFLMNRNLKNNKGFTLVEIMATMSIIVLLAAIAAPSMLGFLDSGRQTNRMNIARTLFVAAQSRLSEMKVNKTLKETLTGKYYEKSGSTDKFTEIINNAVLEADSIEGKLKDDAGTRTNYPEADEKAGNVPYIVSISKAKGDDTEENPVNKLLKPVVIDKDVLNNAIVIEYNIKTGVVSSVFYSDVVDELDYDNTDNSNSSIYGTRPYTSFSERKQGYYGVDYTGQPEPVPLTNIVEIYDGTDKPLDINDVAVKSYENVLYFEAYLPKDVKTAEFGLADVKNNNTVLNISVPELDKLSGNFSNALINVDTSVNKELIYSEVPGSKSIIQYGVDISSSYKKYIWVIDYIKGDVLENAPYNINSRYSIAQPHNVRAFVTTGGAEKTTSLSVANTHFSGSINQGTADVFILKSARHLYNIRHFGDKGYGYRQISHIEMKYITNFPPISNFKGNYLGLEKSDKPYVIRNLTIDTSGSDRFSNIGLFGEITGKNTIIRGIALENAQITGNRNKSNFELNVGSIAGKLFEGLITQSYAFANVTASGGSGGNVNVGGLVGFLDSGVLSQSYNGGFYDATQQTSDNPLTGSVTADMGNIGGLVGYVKSTGLLDGIIINAYNNARVNIKSVTVDTTGSDAYLSKDPKYFNLTAGITANLGGIVGNNAGTVISTYFTNYEAIYETNPHSGGIIGTGTPALKSYYISNGSSDPTSISKADLVSKSPELSSLFVNSNEIYAQGKDTATYYPYPKLKTLNHVTPWEDIKEIGITSSARLSYYELYTDGTWGFSSNGSLAEAKDNKLVANDGYCIDFSYGNNFKLYLGNTLYEFTDTANSNNNPKWEWKDSNAKLSQLPVPYKVEVEGVEEIRYRLFIDNKIGEGLMPLLSDLSAKPIGIKLISNNVQVLSEGPGDTDTTKVYFNPLFANAIYTSDLERPEFIVRSPRHLDNVDRITSAKIFTQQLNLDFKPYRREIKVDISADTINITLNENAKMPTNESVVDMNFGGTYLGQNKYIRNVLVNLDGADGQGSSKIGIGLFAQISGTVKQIALIDSKFIGKKNLGGITSELHAGGTIQQCHVSHVEVEGTNTAAQVLGGIVGVNRGNVSDVYYNHSFKAADGTFAPPVYTKENASNKVIGGIIGEQDGSFNNAYTTALGFGNKPTIGTGKEGNQIYFLQTGIYNENADSNQGVGIIYGDKVAWDFAAMFPGNDNWATADESTTHLTQVLAGKAYPYPRLKDMNHYMDWPILEIVLKYYEVYDDDSVGYFFYLDDKLPINTLSYDPERTVVEEGYLLDLVTVNNYNIRFKGNASNDISDRPSELFDGRRVIKFTHSEIGGVITGSNKTPEGLSPTKIEASSVGDTFVNELKGLGDNGSVYFNPMFANEIYLLKESDTVPATKTLEVRSPRQMLNINGEINSSGPKPGTVTFTEDFYSVHKFDDIKNTGTFANGNTTTVVTFDDITVITTEVNDNIETVTSVKLDIRYNSSENKYYSTKKTTTIETIIIGYNPDEYKPINIKDYNFNQTISLNFATEELNGRKNYKIDGKPLNFMGRNVISDFAGIYDGRVAGMLDPETRRPASYRIYDLVMYISTQVPLRERTGSAFGDLQKGASVRNLEFIDPQIRYQLNGMGGGIVSNINYGIIDNIKVQSINRINLFADANGNVDTVFCGTRQDNHYFDYSDSLGIQYAHVHGGIAGITYGPDSKIINCIVGTNSHNIEDIVDNKTKITCFSQIVGNYTGNTEYMYHVGGIVGVIANSSQVISSANIADIHPNLSKMATYWASTTNTGGIAGAIFVIKKPMEGEYTGQIVGCYNAGTVRAYFGFLGGIVGTASGSKTDNAKIVSCYNTGRINIEEDIHGILTQITPKDGVSIRIGGICGETGNTQFLNCYNIGYISGKLPPSQNDTEKSKASGSIFGLASYDTYIENCFSLQADQYKPDTIVGKNLFKIEDEGNRLAKINGIDTISEFERLFSTFWETRENLRNNKIITSSVYRGESYPGLDDLPTKNGQNKDYAIFKPAEGFYIYPDLSRFTHENNDYVNTHITPWEYIDAIYDTTLKYYEKYFDNTFGFYSLDLKGNPISNLQDKQVVEDGYYLEIGKTGEYDVVINGTTIKVNAVENVLGTGKIGIEFNEDIKSKIITGYNKIRLFTRLSKKQYPTNQEIEDDKHNRIIGTTTTVNADSVGKDLYFDFNFPSEIKYSEASLTPEISTKLNVRSLRHLSNISKLAAAGGSLSNGRTFEQVINIDAAQYNDSLISNYDSFKVFSGAVVKGDFRGVYDGNYKVINNLKISSNEDKVGLFETNKGVVQKITVHEPHITGSLTAGALKMGVIAAENEGTIQLSAVTGFDLEGTGSHIIQNIGSVTGHNKTGGYITDVYAVYKQQDDTRPEIPIRTSGSGDNSLGGLIGYNEGRAEFSLYIAKAPVENGFAFPIVGKSYKEIGDTVVYLGGKDFNDNVNPGTPGIPKSTQQFRNMNLADWLNWGPAGTYPYPSIRNLAPPTDYPLTDSLEFTLAYYEIYDDGDAGFFNYSNDVVPVIQNSLNPSKTVTKRGYCFIIPTGYTGVYETLGGKNVVYLNDTGAEIIKATLNNYETANGYSYYNPAFEKAIFNTQTPRNPVYTIRTPEQMRKISEMKNTAGVAFRPENDLDFKGITLDNSVVTGEFKGTFGNADNTISIKNLTIEASTVDNIGLFSHNSGTVQNIILEPVTSIKGNDNVGGIAGKNFGLIQNCTVTGDTDGKGMHIEGNDNVGGIAGYNNGRLVSNTVQNTTETVKGNNIVGGIAGLNDTIGTIAGATVNKIKVESVGSKLGKLFGENKNTAVNSVTGTVDGVGSNLVELGIALEKANQAYSDAVEGYEIGKFLPGSKVALQGDIDRAKLVYENSDSSAQDINLATTDIKAALDKFYSKRVLGLYSAVTNIEAVNVSDATLTFAVESPITDNLGTSYSDRAVKDQKVTLNIATEPGFAVAEIYARDSLNDEVPLTTVTQGLTYKFTMPSNDVNVTVVVVDVTESGYAQKFGNYPQRTVAPEPGLTEEDTSQIIDTETDRELNSAPNSELPEQNQSEPGEVNTMIAIAAGLPFFFIGRNGKFKVRKRGDRFDR